jgi:hypothetical protein
MVYNDICSMTSEVMVFVINSKALSCHEKMSLNMFQSLKPPWCGASSYISEQYKGKTPLWVGWMFIQNLQKIQ